MFHFSVFHHISAKITKNVTLHIGFTGNSTRIKLEVDKDLLSICRKIFAQEKDCTVHYYDISDIITIFKGSSPNFASNIE